jgi:nucleotide-binding universal stress UspA family protein
MGHDLLSRVLVPLDGSANAEAILSHLRRVLPRHDSQLILFHAIPNEPWSEDQEAEKYLRRIAFQLTNDGYPASFRLRTGLAAESILRAASEERASLIALTTHGRTGALRWVFGSVAERVLQASPLPVLVTRSIPSTHSLGKLESRPIHNFLVPLDGSRTSLGILDPVLSLVRPVDAHVTLLHVTEPFPYENRWESPDETLKEADRLFRDACIPARIEHRKGDPREEILKAVEERAIDLIAMTTHGRSGPSRWVFGSVTAQLLRSALVPLLVVRQTAPSEHIPEKTTHLVEDSPPGGSPAQALTHGTGLAHPKP